MLQSARGQLEDLTVLVGDLVDGLAGALDVLRDRERLVREIRHAHRDPTADLVRFGTGERAGAGDWRCESERPEVRDERVLSGGPVLQAVIVLTPIIGVADDAVIRAGSY